MRTFLFLAITPLLLGAIFTVMLWPYRADPRTRRLLAVLWAFIGVAIPLAALAAITSIGVSALYIFDLLSERLRTAGVPKLLAKGIAAIGVLPVLYGLVLVFFRGGSKRYVGVGILSACAATYFFTSYAFARRHDGYVIRADNTLDFCDEPGGTDRITLKSCRVMTPEVLYLLSRARRDKSVSVFDWPPPDQILTTDGKPQRWYCPRSDGSYVFAVAPVYDPITGRKCQAPTRAVIERYREEHRTLEPPRQGSTSPILLPFVEDFTDGKYDSIHAVGDWKIKDCGAMPCICARGTGPLWFTFFLNNVPLHQFSIKYRISGKSWSSRTVYHPRGIVVTHNWQLPSLRDSEYGGCVNQSCMRVWDRNFNQYHLPGGWHQVTLKPIYQDEHPVQEYWGWKPASVRIWLQQEATPWNSTADTGTVVLANGQVVDVEFRGPAGKFENFNAMFHAAWGRATVPINRITVELKQPFESELCVAQFEIQPMMTSLGQANIQ